MMSNSQEINDVFNNAPRKALDFPWPQYSLLAERRQLGLEVVLLPEVLVVLFQSTYKSKIHRLRK